MSHVRESCARGSENKRNTSVWAGLLQAKTRDVV